MRRTLVWDALTKAEHLKHWMGPAGTTMDRVAVDLRPGGIFHYGMATPGGTMWGKWTFKEIVPPEKLVVIVAFLRREAGRHAPPHGAHMAAGNALDHDPDREGWQDRHAAGMVAPTTPTADEQAPSTPATTA